MHNCWTSIEECTTRFSSPLCRQERQDGLGEDVIFGACSRDARFLTALRIHVALMMNAITATARDISTPLSCATAHLAQTPFKTLGFDEPPGTSFNDE